MQSETPPQYETGVKNLWVALLCILAIWAMSTWLFWIGYVGVDDIFYARYAHFLHRPPMVWWEFRIPFILVQLACFSIFGTTELAAAMPTLAASLALVACTGWMIGWPRKLTWETNLTMVLAAVLPLDLAFRSWPSATYFAGALCGVGTAFWLRGNGRLMYIGSAIFAFAFAAHESMVFYIAIFCGLCLLSDWKRFLKPMLLLGVLVAINFAAEAGAYQKLLGHPFARYQMSSSGAAKSVAGYDADTGISGLRFYTWPIEILFASKHFAGSLLLLLVGGAMAWRKLSRDQKLLFLTVAGTWVWIGWGTLVPWTYQPFFRQFHYFSPILLGLNTLMPAVVFLVLRPLAARCLLIGMVGIYFLAAGSGGRWGEAFESSRALLVYADKHPTTTFLTDVSTMNHMYAIRGFTLPTNVICLNGPAVAKHLLLNKEPVGTPVFAFANAVPQAILFNTEGPSLFAYEEEFTRFVEEHPGEHETVLPVQRKWLFAHIPGISNRPLAIRNLGAEVIHFKP